MPSRRARRPAPLSAIIVCAILCAPLCGAEVDTKLRLDAFYGHDDNPLELAEDPQDGFYTQGELSGLATLQWSPRAGAFAQADVTGRAYERGLGDADAAWGDARAGLAFSPWRRGDRRFSFSLGGTYTVSRSTFIDPGTGEVYVVNPDPNTFVEVPDRFNFNAAGSFLDLRWRVGQRVLLLLDTRWERRSFEDDYQDTAGPAPLDDRTLELEPGVRLDLGRSTAIEVSLDWSDRRFDELESLDQDANAVSGTRRHYRGTGLRVAWSFEPTKRWKFTAGLQGDDRADQYAGYYDSFGSLAFVSMDTSVSHGLRFGTRLSHRSTQYDHATVDGDPTASRRRGDLFRATGRAEKLLGTHFSVLMEAGLERSNDEDPVYQYDRRWVHTGARFRL